MTTISNMSDEQKEERKKCNRCSVNLLLKDFNIKRSGEYTKQCNQCTEYAKKQREKNKCPHNRRKSHCKDCGGSCICTHNRQKSRCKDCGGASICTHNRRKSQCKECGGSSICTHNRQKNTCKECGGSSICTHNRRKENCKECWGSGICIHNRHKWTCKECGGVGICIHGRIKSTCKECDISGYIRHITGNRIRSALNANKENNSIEYLGCTIEEFKDHIEKQFTDGMSWNNHGEWHIDHIIPVKYENPTLEDVIQRLHWTNTQPLWAGDNIAKGNRFIGKKEDYDEEKE